MPGNHVSDDRLHDIVGIGIVKTDIGLLCESFIETRRLLGVAVKRDLPQRRIRRHQINGVRDVVGPPLLPGHGIKNIPIVPISADFLFSGGPLQM